MYPYPGLQCKQYCDAWILVLPVPVAAYGGGSVCGSKGMLSRRSAGDDERTWAVCFRSSGARLYPVGVDGTGRIGSRHSDLDEAGTEKTRIGEGQLPIV